MEIKVENIKCNGCMTSIKNSLAKLEGIDEVTIAPDLETIIIKEKSTIDRASIVKSLEKMGYPEKGNNNVIHKAKSYVSCAIGRLD